MQASNKLDPASSSAAASSCGSVTIRNRSFALSESQSFNVQQVAAHVALNMHKSAEHAAQAGSFDVRPVQRDNAKSVEPVQHASVEGRVEYGGAAMNNGQSGCVPS